jgi:hypothetical protein
MTHNFNIRRGREAGFIDRPMPCTGTATKEPYLSPCPATCAAVIDAGWRDRRRWIREIQERLITHQAHL